MVTLDQIVGNGKKSTPNSSLDAILQQDEDRFAHKLKMLDARAAELDREKRIAQSERELQNIEGVAPQSQASGSTNTALELVKMLTKQGMEYAKAMEMVTSMEPETLAKLAMMSGNQTGINSLMPLLLFSGQKGVTAKDLVEVGKSYVDAASAKMQNNQAMNMTDFANAVNALRPVNTEGNKAYELLASRVDSLIQQSHQSEMTLREQLHNQQLQAATQLQQERDQRWSDRFDQLNEKLEEGKRSPKEILGELKETAEAFGMSVTGAKSNTEEYRDILDTITNSDSIKQVTGAWAERIKTGGGGVKPKLQPAGVSPGAAAMGSAILCDVCMQQGKRTVIPITPQTQQFTCPECKTTFARGGNPNAQAPNGGSSPPPPPSGPKNPGFFG